MITYGSIRYPAKRWIVGPQSSDDGEFTRAKRFFQTSPRTVPVPGIRREHLAMLVKGPSPVQLVRQGVQINMRGIGLIGERFNRRVYRYQRRRRLRIGFPGMWRVTFRIQRILTGSDYWGSHPVFHGSRSCFLMILNRLNRVQ